MMMGGFLICVEELVGGTCFGGAGGDIRELTLSTDRHSWENMTCVLRKTGLLLAQGLASVVFFGYAS